MVKIDINELIQVETKRNGINAIPLNDIQWMNGDVELIVNPETLDEWKFIDLSNIDFVTMGIIDAGVRHD